MLSPEQLTKLATALQGLPVLGCRPESPAARAGIRYGDVVLSVNGMPTPDWTKYAEARSQRASAMAVAIFRGGEELELELTFDPPSANGLDLPGWVDYLTRDHER